jgi:ribonuclease HI
MKTLKFEHHLAEQIRSGERTATWRIYDDKQVAVNDEVVLIDKVEPGNPESWVEIGTATVDRVIEKRLRDIHPGDYEGHEPFQDIEDILTTYRKYYGPEVTVDTVVKIIHFTLKKGNVANTSTGSSGIEREVKLYADGGSRGNPGPSASGYVLLTMNDEIVVKNGVYLGITTNNQAEYLALKFGLEHALRSGVRTVHVYMDSLLVVNQMLGVFKVRNRDLWPIHEAIKELVPQFEHVSFAHVPRELNKLADGQVNECLDKQVTSHR